MPERQLQPTIDCKPLPCGLRSEFDEAADQYSVKEWNEESQDEIEEFLKLVREMTRHSILDQCRECEEKLMRSYQTPPGCENPVYGSEVLHSHNIFAAHASGSLREALEDISVNHPELQKLVAHVRECFGCALVIGEFRDQA